MPWRMASNEKPALGVGLREQLGEILVRKGRLDRHELAQALAERLLKLTACLELFDDVGAADQLALDEDLRDRRPAGDRCQLLADCRIRQHVDRGHGRTGAP